MFWFVRENIIPGNFEFACVRACVRVRACACVRACVRVCVRACVCVRSYDCHQVGKEAIE